MRNRLGSPPRVVFPLSTCPMIPMDTLKGTFEPEDAGAIVRWNGLKAGVESREVSAAAISHRPSHPANNAVSFPNLTENGAN